MYRYEETVTETPYRSAAWRLYTDGLNVGFLDLETTGLARRRDAVILGGLLRINSDGSQTITQLLCDDRGEEGAMLKEFWDQVSQCHILVTYNGDSFDLPFLKARLIRHNIVSERDMPPVCSLDLYRIFHGYCPMASLLSDLKQKTVEDALGLAELRKDQIDGAESVRLFERYARRNQELKENQQGALQQSDCCEVQRLRHTILLHNRDDLAQLMRLMKILDKVDLHRIMSRRGFPVLWENRRFLVESIALNKKKWRIEAATWNLKQDMDVFTPVLRLTHNAETRRMMIQISVMYLQNCIVADLEALPGDYGSLSRYPAYESGYLILHDGKEASCAPMNHAIQLLLRRYLCESLTG